MLRAVVWMGESAILDPVRRRSVAFVFPRPALPGRTRRVVGDHFFSRSTNRDSHQRTGVGRRVVTGPLDLVSFVRGETCPHWTGNMAFACRRVRRALGCYETPPFHGN